MNATSIQRQKERECENILRNKIVKTEPDQMIDVWTSWMDEDIGRHQWTEREEAREECDWKVAGKNPDPNSNITTDDWENTRDEP